MHSNDWVGQSYAKLWAGMHGQFMPTYVLVGPRNTVLWVGQVMLSCWWVRPIYVKKKNDEYNAGSVPRTLLHLY